MLYVANGQAHRERGYATEENHRQRKQGQHAQKRTEEQSRIVGSEASGSQGQQRPAQHRNQADRACAPGRQAVEGFGLWVAVRQASAQPGADRQVEQDQADQVGPDDEGIAEPGIEQPRASQFDAQGDEASGKDQ